MKSQCDKYVVIPYILLLTLSIVNGPVGWGFYCGGVLISSRYILTAAHCVNNLDLPQTWTLSQVRLGEWNTSSQADCVWNDCADPVQDIPVEQIVVHEGYSPNDTNQHNDIALLRLSRNVTFSDFVKPICLPLSKNIQQSTFEGEYMAIGGWGKSEIRSETDVKLRGLLTVVNNNECVKVYNKVNRTIIKSQICAGGGNDTCRIDSGGALMGFSSKTYRRMIVGVLSYKPSPCGTQGWPGVYTRVDAYIDWILSKLEY